MICPLLSLEHLSFSKKETKVCYQYGKHPQELEQMDYLEFIARLISCTLDEEAVSFGYASPPWQRQLYMSEWMDYVEFIAGITFHIPTISSSLSLITHKFSL